MQPGSFVFYGQHVLVNRVVNGTHYGVLTLIVSSEVIQGVSQWCVVVDDRWFVVQPVVHSDYHIHPDYQWQIAYEIPAVRPVEFLDVPSF